MAPLLKKVATFSFVSLLHLIFIIPSARLLLKSLFQSHGYIFIFLSSLVVVVLLLIDKLEDEPKEKLLLDCFALVLFFLFSRQISFAFLLLLVGFRLGKRVCPKILFYTLFSTIPFLHLAPYERFEFFSMDANYTAYFFYLISMPLFFKLLASEYKQKNNKTIFIPLIVISNLLSASRGVLVSLVLIVCTKFKKKITSRDQLTTKKILLTLITLFLASIFVGKHLTDSVDERVHIYSEALHGRVLGLGNDNFNDVHVSPECVLGSSYEVEQVSMMSNSCISAHYSNRPFGFVSLHNTLLTWFFLYPLMFFFFYGYLYWRFGQNFALLSIPTVFLSVGPGPFYLYLGLSIGSAAFKVGK